jgi:AcrR family transcriptional regulator
MPSDTEIKQRIIEKARDWFFQYGFSKVTMDELAAELGMSKKTLYKFFTSKEQLIWEIYEQTITDYKNSYEHICLDASRSFIERMAALLDLGSALMRRWSKTFLADLQKSAPELWVEVEKFKQVNISGRFSVFFAEGIKHGYFRNDIERELVLVIYSKVIQGVLNPEVMSQLSFSPQQTFDALVKILYQGILSDAGRNEYLSMHAGATPAPKSNKMARKTSSREK